MTSLYRERAHLVAFLSKQYFSWLEADTHPEPGFNWILFVETPQGQLSWHIADNDLDLFQGIARRPFVGPAGSSWDGHTTREKYERLDRLGRCEAARSA